jgi:hypothetical protein
MSSLEGFVLAEGNVIRAGVPLSTPVLQTVKSLLMKHNRKSRR